MVSHLYAPKTFPNLTAIYWPEPVSNFQPHLALTRWPHGLSCCSTGTFLVNSLFYFWNIAKIRSFYVLHMKSPLCVIQDIFFLACGILALVEMKVIWMIWKIPCCNISTLASHFLLPYLCVIMCSQTYIKIWTFHGCEVAFSHISDDRLGVNWIKDDKKCTS